jgi:uncharacterized NAD(P)/FAD-binding protein YdhS
MTSIAIVGAGFSGTLLALHLLRRCPASTQVRLIERNSQFGRGPAYSTGNPSHLLNVPAGRMSAFYDQPSDFVAWLSNQNNLPPGVEASGTALSRGNCSAPMFAICSIRNSSGRNPKTGWS